MKTTALSIIAAVVVATSSLAHADDRARAEAHFRSAEAHFQSGNYRDAIRGYSDSYKLFPAPLLLFNIALCHEYLGEKQEAVDKYREYLAKEPKGDKAPEARDRADKLEKLIKAEKAAAEQKRRAQIAELKVKIADLRAKGKHADLAVALGELNELEPDPELIFDRAAAHEAAGERDAAIEHYVRYLATDNPKRGDEAKRRRDALSQAGGNGDGNGDSGGNGGNGGGGNGGDIIAPPPEQPGEGPSIVTPAVASGVAVVALGLGVYFGLDATGTRDNLQEEIDAANPPLDSNDPRFDDIGRSATLANVMFATSLVAAGVSGYLWYRYVSARKEAPASLSLGPRSGGVDVGVKVRF